MTIEPVPFEPMSLDPSTVFVRNSSILAKEVDGEAVMLSIDNGKYYGLDAVGTAIWDLVSEPTTLETICDRLVERYEVDRSTCESEVSAFLSLLIDDGSVLVAEQA